MYDYLVITLDFSEPVKLKVKILDYVVNIIAEVTIDVNVDDSTTSAEIFLDFNQSDPVKLDETVARNFHHLFTKFMFIFKSDRPYL